MGIAVKYVHIGTILNEQRNIIIFVNCSHKTKVPTTNNAVIEKVIYKR